MNIEDRLKELREEFRKAEGKRRFTLELQGKVLKLGLNAKPIIHNPYAKPWPRKTLEENVLEILK